MSDTLSAPEPGLTTTRWHRLLLDGAAAEAVPYRSRWRPASPATPVVTRNGIRWGSMFTLRASV